MAGMYCDLVEEDILQDWEELYLISLVAELRINAHLTPRLLWSVRQAFGPDGSVPTLQAIGLEYIQSGLCSCWEALPSRSVVAAVLHVWQNLTTAFSCQTVVSVCEYEVMEKKWPTDLELQTFWENARQLAQTPEDYCEEKRVCVPTPNLEYLAVDRHTGSEKHCSICLQEIQVGMSISVLAPCGHSYHSNAQDCLGDTSIKNWLQKSTKCPCCQGEVVIKQ